MNNYYIYWTEDRKNNPKNPAIWYCLITSNATMDDLELFDKYNNFIFELSDGIVSVGWIENENNDNIDNFIKDQFFYNEYADDNIQNQFSKYEYDLISFENLKSEINQLLDFYENYPSIEKESLINEAKKILYEKYIGTGKPFLIYKDFNLFINTINNDQKNKRKRK